MKRLFVFILTLVCVFALSAQAFALPADEIASLKTQSNDSGAYVHPMEGSIYQIVLPGNMQASQVQVPTWTEVNGQDDLVWYVAHENDDGTWTVEIDTACHGGGAMISHIYVDGKGVGAVTYTAPVTTGVLAIQKDGYDYTILVSNLHNVSQVKVPTWSNAYGQDDIVWYDAHSQGNGIWIAEVNTSNHGGGAMISHVYADQNGVGQVAFTAPASTPRANSKTYADSTRYSIIIENLWGASKVQVPTWGAMNGQNDIVWYSASKIAPGTWSVTIDAANHDKGAIDSHVYADGRNTNASVRVTRDFPVLNDFKCYGRSLTAYADVSLKSVQNLMGSLGERDDWYSYTNSWAPLTATAYCNESHTHVEAFEIGADKVLFDGVPLNKTVTQIQDLIGVPDKREWTPWPHTYLGIYTMYYYFGDWKVALETDMDADVCINTNDDPENPLYYDRNSKVTSVIISRR